ncbi:MAG: hypothetical protein DRP01_06680 [Archaeoglobales archaeon]|nr:MAG: hypothetical protein DRP01_06680 [Archaeoglobales archaeon]
MPFRSKAQLRWMAAAVKRGEISKRTFEEWLRATKNVKRLPERVHKRRHQALLRHRRKGR